MKWKGLTSTQLKTIAITAMLLDHFAGLFINHDTIGSMALRVPGRIVAPIMCYMISEGFSILPIKETTWVDQQSFDY